MGLGEVVQLLGHLGQRLGQLGQVGQATSPGRDPQLGQGAGGLGEQVVEPAAELVGALVGRLDGGEGALGGVGVLLGLDSTWVR